MAGAPQIMVQPNMADKRRQALAASMMKQGTTYRPMRHPLEAFGQMAQAYVGGKMAADADENLAGRREGARATLSEAMTNRANPPSPYPNADAAFFGTLATNPDTSDLAMQMQMNQISAQQETASTGPKVPSGYQKAAGGGIEQIPGWINTARYKPVTTTDEAGNQITNLYDVGQLNQQGQPMPGAQPIDVPGGPQVGPDGLIQLGVKKEKTLTPEAAAKTSMMQQGMTDVKKAQSLLFNDDGSINRKNAINAWAGTPGTDGRLVYSYYFNAINAKLRAESGAAVPEEEVSRGIRTFMPSVLDNDKTGREKIKRLHEFLGSTLTNMEGSGRYVPKDAALREWMNKNEPVTTRTQFDKLKSGDTYTGADGKQYRKP